MSGEGEDVTLDVHGRINEMWIKLATGVCGLMGIAFFAWAGVVWSAWQDVSSMLFEVHSTVREIAVKVHHNEERIKTHENRAWHDGTAGVVSTIGSRVDVMAERIDRVEKDVGAVRTGRSAGGAK